MDNTVVTDELLLHAVGAYADEFGDYRSVRKRAKIFGAKRCGYSYPLIKTHKLTEE